MDTLIDIAMDALAAILGEVVIVACGLLVLAFDPRTDVIAAALREAGDYLRWVTS